MGVEERGVQRDGQAHHLCPAGRALGVQGEDCALQRLVEMPRIVLVGSLRRAVASPDRPPSDSFDVAVEPPAIQNAQARDSVVRGLYPAGARGL
jgi:hypothetical protein